MSLGYFLQVKLVQATRLNAPFVVFSFMKNKMVLFTLHTFMRFKVLYKMLALLYDRVFYYLLAHAKVPQRGQTEPSHCFPVFIMCKGNSLERKEWA